MRTVLTAFPTYTLYLCSFLLTLLSRAAPLNHPGFCLPTHHACQSDPFRYRVSQCYQNYRRNKVLFTRTRNEYALLSLCATKTGSRYRKTRQKQEKITAHYYPIHKESETTMKDMENSSSGMAHYYPVETVISCCGMARYSPVDMESETTMNLSKKVGDPRQDSKRKIVIALCSTCVLTIFAISLIFGLAFSKTQDTKPNEIKLPNKTQDVQFPENQKKINIPFPSKKFTIDATLILKETAYFDVYIQRNNGKPHHYGHECSELHCFIKMQVRIPCTPDDNVTMTIEPKKSLVSVEKLTVDFTPMRNNTNE